MNRKDVVDLVVDLVDLDLDVDLAVSLCDGPRSVLFSFGLVAPTCFIKTVFLYCFHTWARAKAGKTQFLYSVFRVDMGPATFCFNSRPVRLSPLDAYGHVNASL